MGYATRAYIPVPKKVESLYQGRIRQFNDANGQYRDLNLPHYFDRTRIDFNSFVRLSVYSVPDLRRPLFDDAMKEAEGKWRAAKKGDSFGPSWSTHWFKIELKIPGDWKEKYDELPLFDFDSSDEGFVYTDLGVPMHGLSGEHKRTEIELPKAWRDDGQWHVLYIETSCNNITGTGSPPDPNRQFRLNRADLLVPNAITRALNIDFWILGDAGREFPGNSWQKHKAQEVLNRIINTFDRNNVDESSYKCREIAAAEFLGDVDTSKIYSSKKSDELVWAVGNCHIDTAWLWPYAETRRKIARSWSTQLDLIARYPEYTFAASQAVQFQWLKEDHPDLFKRVQIAVKDGRFIPIGGSWVECDTNLPNGESLVRQMVLGQRFFEREFGFRSKVFWLPDTFGYAPQLPQICRQAGQPYFLTQKLSWNNIDVFPLSTFSWIGLDATQVVCHMPPANTYTAQAHFGDVKRSIENHKNLDTSQRSLLLYGHGDGGGGPTDEMIEKLRRCRGLANKAGLLPKVVTGKEYTPNAFFDSLVEDSNDGKTLPTWNGELYLEYHRGTYTTQAAIKRGNRVSEVLMRDLEMFAASASIKNKEYEYPYEAIERLWGQVCLNQFHDVLPGSGIEMIYEDARKIYEDVWQEGSKLVKEALVALGYEVLDDFEDPDACYLADVDGHATDVEDARLQATYEKELPCEFELLEYVELKDENEHEFKLENDSFSVQFREGQIYVIYDKVAERDVLGGHHTRVGNNLVLYEDQPLNFPAWDTEQYVFEKKQELKPQTWRKHDDISAEVAYEFNNSKIHQRIVLHKSYIEFATNVDWHETYQFLKAEFPIDLITDQASYETAFGIQRRATHTNTSWDAAKFEVCGHRFADISDWRYGVSLLNDSKYGYSIQGNVMRLSLLRAPKSPDAHADMGTHSFRYALAPHNGPLSPEIVKLAQFFNHPHHWVKNPKQKRPDLTSRRQAPHLIMTKGDSSITVSAIKRADADKDEDSRTIAVRVYETMGGIAHGELYSYHPIKAAWETNILEDEDSKRELKTYYRDQDEAEVDFVPINLKAFEVRTILIQFA